MAKNFFVADLKKCSGNVGGDQILDVVAQEVISCLVYSGDLAMQVFT